ncbi:MAG: D-alanyl-D-alanine carboxypeptidase [Clostridia bacterium]|nr:D-alanyl-D-alanine carboxypeptidase [Clostridia bacterium]
MRKITMFLLVFILAFCHFGITASAIDVLSVSAKSAVVICTDTREVLFEKSAKQKMPMASTTKIMTALILAEQPDLSKTVEVTKQMVTVEGSSMGLLAGDTVSYRDLLYGMLLASGNDAANTVAFVLGGSVEGFAKMMNKKAREIGLENTNFVTPSGLDDENHYTTAYDLALLTSVALKNTAFRTACGSKQAVLYYGNPPYKRTLTNHNKLLGNFDGAIGVKTGFTKKSGRCLVTAAERDGKGVIAVTLNAPDDWSDHKALLVYGLSETERLNINNDDITDIIPVVSSDADHLRIKAEPMSLCVSAKSKNSVKRVVEMERFLYAPVKAGQTVGKISYYLGNTLIGSSNIYSVADLRVRNKKEKFSVRFLKNLLLIWNNC